MWPHLLALVLLLLPSWALASAEENVAALAPWGLVLVRNADGDKLVAQNADQPFVPASVTKIVTVWLALELFGDDYRPKLVAAISKEPIGCIVLDASYYPSDLRISRIEDTKESYDALNSTLAENFNTIYAVRKGNRVLSAERRSRCCSPTSSVSSS